MAFEKIEKLFWLDMEMTGLDVNKEVVIEVACIVTDLNFKELETFETVVKQPQSYLDSMDEWNKKHHGDSGLTAKVPHGMEPSAVEFHLISMIERHFPDAQRDRKMRPILAGNSISQDRLFIDKYFTKLSEKLHYRMLDVSSWKIIFNNKFEKVYKKQNSHRALDDIRESIGELRYYLDQVNPS
ncbi:MAG: oligoribonuclease [Pseudobdellovibrio sp.]